MVCHAEELEYQAKEKVKYTSAVPVMRPYLSLKPGDRIGYRQLGATGFVA